MNKIKNILSGAFAIGLMAACSGSTEHIEPELLPGDIVIKVTTRGAEATSRAVKTIPGYTLKISMQPFADDGVAVGDRVTISAVNGEGNFVLHTKDRENGATKALFWAEYIPDDELETPRVYNSDDLSNITYNETEFDMADADRMAATEAFAGVLNTLEHGASVTLRRPFIQLNFTPTNPENARGETAIKVNYEAPAGYNMIDGTYNEEAYQELTYTNLQFNINQQPWFSNFIFAPANLSTLDRPVTLSLSGRVDQTLTIPANKIPLDANTIVNASASISYAETQDLDINVSVDKDYVNDPDREVEIQLGTYINSKGKGTLDRRSAVAIVFYMGAMSGDSPALYPEEFKEKQILAYAVATENVLAKRAQFNQELIPTGWPQNDKLVNGTQNGEFVLSQLGESAFFNGWYEWTSAHPLSSEGISTTGWYLPARPQMEEWMSLLMETTALNNQVIPGTPSGSREIRQLFPLNTIFDRDPFEGCMYATCSVNSNGNIQGTNLTATENGTNGTVKFSQIDIKTKTQSVLGRPMITIFEDNQLSF